MKKYMRFFLLLCIMCLLTACGKDSESEESGYRIWYMNQEETSLSYENREIDSESASGMLQEMLELIREQPEDESLKPVLPEDVRIDSCKLQNNLLYLNFSEEYLQMPKVYEVLCRAAVVRTMCQIPDVDYVIFRVDNNDLLDQSGKAIGLMNDEQFIENAGDEINAYKSVELTLYYANEAGDKLVTQDVDMEYNSNISLEKLIVERLIQGPPFEGAYPAIPSSTKLLSISTKDGICYVNLDEGFLDTGYNVAESIPVYSIVNSLIENTDATKVQLSINGETNLVYYETINFETLFEKKDDIVEEPDE